MSPSLVTPSTARKIIEGEKKISFDLGLSYVDVSFMKNMVVLPDGSHLSLGDLEEISRREDAVFFVEEDKIYQAAISDERFYKLVPTDGAPTLEIDGVRMHRTKEITPDADAAEKLRALGLYGGRVLDTCCGLGYTALEALHCGGELVVSVEMRPQVLRIAGLNPWSRELFLDKRIHLVLGDAGVVVKALKKGFFDFIVHDPPRFSRAGQLYGREFYKGLFGLLRPRGGLYHYTGEPGSRYRGQDLKRGVIKRLRGVGFVDVKYVEKALGVVCLKPAG
ncbi:MAG: RsmD family RNA methyltransferase [Candidatus Bathyarchaeota archaeon]|jgi:hypothetical protein